MPNCGTIWHVSRGVSVVSRVVSRRCDGLLHRIFFPYKLVVLNGEIVKLVEHHGRRSPRQKSII